MTVPEDTEQKREAPPALTTYHSDPKLTDRDHEVQKRRHEEENGGAENDADE